MSTEENGGSAEELARKKDEEREQAKDEIAKLENGDMPSDLDDWPSGPAKYETFGMDDDAYGEGATAKLGPANLERHKDGSVSIDGEKVDNPDDYKGEPIVTAIDKAKDEDESEEDSEGAEKDKDEDGGSDS
jgi:hypothetical protein